MRKFFILWIFIATILWIVCFSNTTKAEEWSLSLWIKKEFLTIAGSWLLNIWTISSNPAIEERLLSLENILQIRDLSGLCSWHYTTIQFSDLSDWVNLIGNQNISLNLNNITTIAGISNPSQSIWSILYNIRWFTDNTTTYINRAFWTNCWYIWQYWTTWEIKINIPANQVAGTYRWKIYYLLIDNNQE